METDCFILDLGLLRKTNEFAHLLIESIKAQHASRVEGIYPDTLRFKVRVLGDKGELRLITFEYMVQFFTVPGGYIGWECDGKTFVHRPDRDVEVISKDDSERNMNWDKMRSCIEARNEHFGLSMSPTAMSIVIEHQKSIIRKLKAKSKTSMER